MCHGAAASRGRRRQCSSVLGRPLRAARAAGGAHCRQTALRARGNTRPPAASAQRTAVWGKTKLNKTKNHEIFIWSRGKKSRGTPRAVTGGHSLAAGVLCGSTKRCGQQRGSHGPRALPAVGRPANGGPGRAQCCSQRPPATRRGRARAVRAALPRCNRRLAPLREPPRATPPLAVLALLPLTASARALVSRVLRVGFHPTSS